MGKARPLSTAGAGPRPPKDETMRAMSDPSEFEVTVAKLKEMADKILPPSPVDLLRIKIPDENHIAVLGEFFGRAEPPVSTADSGGSFWGIPIIIDPAIPKGMIGLVYPGDIESLVRLT